MFLPLAAVALLVAWGMTQDAARHLGYAPQLGPPWLAGWDHEQALEAAWALAALAVVLFIPRRTRALALPLAGVSLLAFALSCGPLYPPLDILVWARRLGPTPETRAFWHGYVRVLGLVVAGEVVVGLVVYAILARGLREASDLHGSARWAREWELRGAGLFAKGGLVLGQWGSRVLRHDGPEHIFVFAPTRSGKGVSIVLPNLLEWPGSVLVHDMKGENWALSAGWRSRELGQLCLRFDPTSTDGSGARYNPLAEIRLGDFEVRDTQNVADILVDPNGDRVRDHWDRTAHSLLVGVILHVLYAEREKTLAGCASFLARPDRPIEDGLETMLGTEHAPPSHPGWHDPATRERTRRHPTVAAAARALLDKSPNERSGVLSTALSFLDLYRDPVLARNTAVSDFSLRDLVDHEDPISLYLAVPPSDLSRTRPLVRLLLNQACRRLTERMDFGEGRGRGAGKHPLLLLLDEFPALGRLAFFAESLAYLAGYDIRALLVTQDLAQHQGVYGRQESITANCRVRVAFAANKPETAELVSQMVGDTTVRHAQVSIRGAGLLGERQVTRQEVRRRLLTADEVMRIPDDSEVVLVAGLQPILARKRRYFEDRELRRRAALPPPAVSSHALRQVLTKPR